jgi:hypothetical protein
MALGIMASIFQDWYANNRNVNARIVLLAFRIASLASSMPQSHPMDFSSLCCVLSRCLRVGVGNRVAMEVESR